MLGWSNYLYLLWISPISTFLWALNCDGTGAATIFDYPSSSWRRRRCPRIPSVSKCSTTSTDSPSKYVRISFKSWIIGIYYCSLYLLSFLFDCSYNLQVGKLGCSPKTNRSLGAVKNKNWINLLQLTELNHFMIFF